MRIRLFLYKSIRKICYLFSRIFNIKFDHQKFEKRYIGFLSFFKKYGCHTINDHKLKYEINSDIGQCLFLYGEFEKNDIEVCLKYIDENSNVLDIGANFGLHSANFASKCVNGNVFSFEPVKKTFRNLVNNSASFKNITCFNIALSGESKITNFYVAEDDAYSGLKDTKRKEIVGIERVLAYELDKLIQPLNISSIDFIKIDVEGFEHEVLTGMHEIIKRYKPKLFIEIFGGTDSNTAPEATINMVAGLGYNVFVLKDNEIVSFEVHNDNFHNYLFIPN